MDGSDVEGPLRVRLEDDPVLHPLRPEMLVNLVKLVKPGDQRRGHKDQPGSVRVVGHLDEHGRRGQERGEQSREVRSGVDGHVDPVSRHQCRQGVVHRDRMDGVAASKNVTEADVVCKEVRIRVISPSLSLVLGTGGEVLTVQRHDTHDDKGGD